MDNPKKLILLDAELKARMDKFPKVNWSKIARDAFEAHCDVLEHVARNPSGPLDKPTLERLLRTEMDDGRRMEERGAEAAHDFAKIYATVEQLERIARLLDRANPKKLEWKHVGVVASRAGESPTKFWKQFVDQIALVKNADFVKAFVKQCSDIYTEYCKATKSDKGK